MEEVFSTILGQRISLVGAGRTDAGVHAKKMVAHFDIDRILDEPAVIARLNSLLPADIAMQQFQEVSPDAHARFDALERSYEYWIVREKDPFFKDTAHYVRQPLDIAAMNKAAAVLLQFEDFECFSKLKTDVKTYLCHLIKAEWTKDDHKLVFTITADRFLRNMVRAIVGTLLEVGRGRIALRDVKTIIKSKDRSRAGASVPAKGLYLTEITYPINILKVDG